MPSAIFVTTVPITLEAFLLPFADRFRETGWRIDGLANGAAGTAGLRDYFDQLFDVTWSRNPLSPKNLFGTADRVRRIVADGRYDIVHVHTPIAAWVTRYALRSLRDRGRPTVIYTAHGFHFYRGQSLLPHAFFRTMERVATPWTDYLVTINDEDFAAAQALGGIEQDHVRLIRGIGVDTRRFAPGSTTLEEVGAIRDGLGVDRASFVLTMVAEFSPVKRHMMALDALARVHDPRVVLVLVGEGPLEGEIRDYASEHGLRDRVRFAGYRRDVPELLAASDAALLCSEREGLNRSVLEAMASGRPVIGTNTRGIADAVGDTGGWIIAKNDVCALSAAIEAAASDPDAVSQRGAAARERAVAEFSLDGVLEEYERLYGEALASRV